MQFNPSMTNTLNLEDLALGLPGVTPRIGAYYAEAAGVCLQEEEHRPGVSLVIGGALAHQVEVYWELQEQTEQLERAWRDREVATEAGAYGVAALLIDQLTDYTVVERSRKGPGFDYWLGPKQLATELFQGTARLEVSGIRRGSAVDIAARVRQKTRQIEPSDGILPGVVVVVEFGSPQTRVRTK